MTDVDNQKQDGRVRNWSWIVYPDSAPENWRSILDETGEKWIESPLHDKDINETTNEIKKPHWHIIVSFKNKKSYEQALDIAKQLNSPDPIKVASLQGAVQYLWHRNNPEKYQYKPSEIIAHGGADIRKYLTATGGDKIKILAEMQDWIDETGCTEFHELARYARNERFDDWYDVIATQSTVFLNAYIRSKRHGGDHNE